MKEWRSFLVYAKSAVGNNPSPRKSGISSFHPDDRNEPAQQKV